VTYSGPGSDGAKAHCLEPHDLVVAKLVAHRMKDLEFADALLRAGLVRADVLLVRASGLEAPSHARLVRGWVVGWVAKYGKGACRELLRAYARQRARPAALGHSPTATDHDHHLDRPDLPPPTPPTTLRRWTLIEHESIMTIAQAQAA